MVTVAVTSEQPISAEAIGADFREAGFDVVHCEPNSDDFFQSIVRIAPDLVVAVSASPSDMLLNSAALLKKVAPRPFVLFTTDANPVKIERAAAAGINSYVVDGYAPKRLRSVAQVAIARFRREQAQGEKLDHLARDLRERKQIERAKGLLMRSRGLNEAAAFELMRSLAMHRRMRLANIAEAVIALSSGAEAVNRSGQLRMLAQRLARCTVQLAHNVHAEWAEANLRECRERIAGNIDMLRRTVTDRGCGPDLERIAHAWAKLRAMTDSPALVEGLAVTDDAAESLTQEAESLTAFLETSGMVTNLRVINLSGRQRMLSQRVGKLCLMLAFDDGKDPALLAERANALRQAATEFTAAMKELERMPLRTPEIERWLKEAHLQWAEMLPFQRGQGAPTRCIEVCERLLEAMEALTTAYEQATQILIGDRMETFETPTEP